MASASSSIIRFPGDSVVYSVPNWDELTELAFQLSLQISADGHRFPVMVTLAKGGLPLARILADFLHIPVILSIGVSFYTGIGTRATTPQIYQDISPLETIRGKSVLLFDDVAESGESLIFAKDYLKVSGAEEVITSSLFYKEKSKIIPDYVGQHTNEWVVFPFEAMETHAYLSARWQQDGVPQAEQHQRFLQLGLREHWLSANTRPTMH